MTTLNYTFEGGADEANVTTSDTGSGNAFDLVNTPAQGGSPAASTIKYDTAWFADGAVGVRIITTDAGSAFVGWDASIGSSTETFTRVYGKRPTALPATRQFIQMRDSSPTTICSARWTTGGNVALHDAAGTARYTSTKAFASGEEYRFEMHVVHATVNGHMEARLFYGANLHGETPDESFGSSSANWNTGAALDHIRYGAMTTAAAATNETVLMDEIEWNNTGWPGPAAISGGGGTPGVVDPLTEPVTTSYTQLNDPNPGAVWTPTLASGVDYILKGPGGVTPWTRTRRLNINGGRHVVVKNMTIDIGVSGGPMVDVSRGHTERDVWFIDCTLADTGKFQADGFKTSDGPQGKAGGNIATGSGGTNIYTLRCRVTGIIGEQDGVHADGIQLSGGVKSWHMQDCTWSSGWVAGQWQRELFQGTNPLRAVTALTRSGTIGTVEVTTGLDIGVGDWVEFGDTVSPTTWRGAWPVRSILLGTRPNVTRFTIFLGDGGQAAWDGAAGTRCYKSDFIYYVGSFFVKDTNFRAQSNAPITVPAQTITAFRVNAGRPDFKGSNAEDRTPALVEGMNGVLVLDNVWVEPNASPPDDSIDELLEPSNNAAVYSLARGSLNTATTPDEFSWPDHTAISGVVYSGVPPGGDFAPAASAIVVGSSISTIPTFTGNGSATATVTATVTGTSSDTIPGFTGTGFASSGVVISATARGPSVTPPEELPTITWTIADQVVEISGWSANCNEGGYDQMRGEVASDAWFSLEAQGAGQGSPVIGWCSTGEVMWAGRLSIPPMVNNGVAPVAAQGYKYAARKKDDRLFIQSRGISAWTTSDSEPHVDENGVNVYSASKRFDVDLSGSRAMFVAERDVPLLVGRENAIIFYAEGVNLARVAWKAHYDAGDETTALTFQPYRANGPTGTETAIGGGRRTIASNNHVDREEIFTEDPADLILMGLMVVEDHTPADKAKYRLTSLRVNSDVCTTDEFNASDVIGYISEQLGYDTTKVESSTFNVLPFDWTSDWLAAGLYVAELEDKFWRVLEGSEYGTWGETTWTVAQAQGASVDLTPLELYDRVEVWFEAISGVRRRAVATADIGVANTFKYELNDQQPDTTLSQAVADVLISRYSTQRYSGTVTTPVARSNQGATNPYLIRYGDMLTVSDFGPGTALTQRVMEASYTPEGVTVGVETPISPVTIIAQLQEARR
jgi:hypothetical protein